MWIEVRVRSVAQRDATHGDVGDGLALCARVVKEHLVGDSFERAGVAQPDCWWQTVSHVAHPTDRSDEQERAPGSVRREREGGGLARWVVADGPDGSQMPRRPRGVGHDHGRTPPHLCMIHGPTLLAQGSHVRLNGSSGGPGARDQPAVFSGGQPGLPPSSALAAARLGGQPAG